MQYSLPWLQLQTVCSAQRLPKACEGFIAQRWKTSKAKALSAAGLLYFTSPVIRTVVVIMYFSGVCRLAFKVCWVRVLAARSEIRT